MFLGSIGKQRCPFASDWLRRFWLLCNHWIHFAKTWLNSKNSSKKKCVFQADRKFNLAVLATETFSYLLVKPLRFFGRNLKESKKLSSSTKLIFFWPIGKQRWPTWHLNCWYVLDFSSETAECNLTTHYRQKSTQCLQSSLCFSDRSENKGGCLGLWLADTFWTIILCYCWTEFDETWQKAITHRNLSKLRVFSYRFNILHCMDSIIL